MSSQVSPDYRPDIDGMRAIAVLGVILFHVDRSWMPGGFVGVDVFFVISGYLISRGIIDNIGRNSFSLVEFYRRRVQRIMPSIAVVVLVTTVIASQILLPGDAEAEAQSAIFSLLSGANIYFWLFQDFGYFAQDSAQLPLLHLWSLGVEEQFYLLYPVILAGLYTPKRRMLVFALFAAITLASFGLGQYLLHDDPSFAYYSLPTRAGELLLGALVAIWATGPSKATGTSKTTSMPWSIFREIAAALGLALVLASNAWFSEDHFFPGWNGAIPTVGAALVIATGCSGPTWVARLLGLKPLVWIGLISYSAYLWHWPVLAFYRYGFGDPTGASRFALFALTLVLAAVAYRLVEQPARRMRLANRQVFSRLLLIPMGVVGLICFGVISTEGYGARIVSGNLESSLQRMEKDARPAASFDYVCQRTELRSKDLNDSACVLGAKAPKTPRILLWGDSNASQFVGMLDVFGQKSGFRFRNIAHSSCPPLFEDPEIFVARERVDYCRSSLEIVRNALGRYPVIIMTSSWSVYQALSDGFVDSVRRTVEELSEHGKQVILMGKIPVFKGYDRLCAKKALTFPGARCSNYDAPLNPKIAWFNAQLKAMASEIPNVSYYDINDRLCPDGSCAPYKDGKNLYFDHGHLTMRASHRLGEEIVAETGVPQVFVKLGTRAALERRKRAGG